MNFQHLSDAKKAQQSLESTYKQLDNVSVCVSIWNAGLQCPDVLDPCVKPLIETCRQG